MVLGRSRPDRAAAKPADNAGSAGLTNARNSALLPGHGLEPGHALAMEAPGRRELTAHQALAITESVPLQRGPELHRKGILEASSSGFLSSHQPQTLEASEIQLRPLPHRASMKPASTIRTERPLASKEPPNDWPCTWAELRDTIAAQVISAYRRRAGQPKGGNKQPERKVQAPAPGHNGPIQCKRVRSCP
jgi:hypothetical protein